MRLTAQLNHPNTIAIYDFGRTPEGIFYYAMELLDGVNLGTLVRGSGPLPEGRVIHLLMQVCGSLHEAHSMGLIHRDVKPANIMLCQRGGSLRSRCGEAPSISGWWRLLMREATWG